MSVFVREETPEDVTAIADVNTQAFHQSAEAKLVDALRAGGDAVLSLVAIDSEQSIVGHALFSRISIVTAEGSVDALSLAPMAVLPARQRQGIGTLLIKEGLQRCAALGEKIVIVLGHPEYYPRFGFSADLAEPLKAPFDVPPEAWMALELMPCALDGMKGRVEYPAAFSMFG